MERNFSHPPYGPLRAKKQSSQQEIRFHAARLASSPTSLEPHIQFEETVNALMIRGEYQKVFDTISEYENREGRTWYSLEASMLASDLSNGPVATKSWLNLFSKETGGIPAVIAYYFSCKAESNYSPESLRADLALLTAKSKNARDIAEYVCFRCDPFTRSTDISFNNALYWSHKEHVLDRYQLTLTIAAHLVCQEAKNIQLSGELFEALASTSPDRRLKALLDCLNNQDSGFNEIDSVIGPILNAYTTGDYKSTISLSLAALKSHPTQYVPYELLAKACIYSGIAPPFFLPPIQLDIVNSLISVLNRGRDFNESIRRLNKLADRLGRHCLSAFLKSECSTIISDRDYWKQYASVLSGSHLLLLRNASLPVKNRIALAQREIKKHTDNAFVELTLQCLRLETSEYTPALSNTIPAPRSSFFFAKAYLAKNDYKSALTHFRQFLHESSHGDFPYSPFAHDEATHYIAECYIALSEASRAVRAIVERYIESPRSFQYLPLQEVTNFLSQESSEIKREIAVPVFVSLTERDTFKVYLALADFLYEHGTEKPTEWIASTAFEQGPISRLLLQRVCVPAVLDSLISLPSPEDVELQRTEILKYLQVEDPNNNEHYQAELFQLAQSRELRLALQEIDRSKVSVNIQGIEDVHGSRFKDAFLRLRDYISLNIAIAGIKIVIKSDSSDKVIDVPISDAFGLFCSIFLEIRDVFTNCAQYSLDSSLSVRIRHGIITRHIARPFERSRLLSRRIGPGFTYERNAFWMSRMGFSNENADIQIQAAFAKFSTTIESIASDLKSSRLHIRTERGNSDGLFDFRFSDHQLRQLFERKFSAIEDAKTFLAEGFNELLDRCRTCLANVRSYLTETVRPALLSAVDEFLDQLQQVDSQCSTGELRSALLLSKGLVTTEIAEICKWFESLDASLMEDCSIDLTVRTALGMLRGQSAGLNEPDFNTETHQKIRGRVFTHLVYVVFCLLENAIKHSGLPPESVEVSVSVSTQGNRVVIRVANSLSEEKMKSDPASVLTDLLADIHQQTSSERARQEGGSGFYKIFSILFHEFKSASFGSLVTYLEDGRIQVEVSFQPNEFFV